MTTAGDPKQKDDGSGGKYGPRLTYAEREAYANSTIPRSGGALDDPRAVQAFILLGWIPPLITAAISSVIVGFRTAASAHSPPCDVPDWVIGNYVGEGASAAPGKECANAKAAVPHSHFFTAEGRFGSRDENGQDVDDGDYQVVDADTLSFPSAARDFGYSGDVLVDYSVAGNEVTFSVKVPTPCDAECRVAYGWALSAFFGPRPFERK